MKMNMKKTSTPVPAKKAGLGRNILIHSGHVYGCGKSRKK
tara:strand:+ start:2485 stop:2604 length:120 start_codon:yes stop_codon:yes gene_type:complete